MISDKATEKATELKPKVGPFYFGCWDRPGHYLVNTGRRSYDQRDLPKSFPFKWSILDGALLPQSMPDVEGRASLIHFPGWTVLSFWDRSVDSRGGCNSAFIFNDHLSFEEATSVAALAFPFVWQRFKFPIVEWKGE